MTASAQQLFDVAQEKIPPPLRSAVDVAWRGMREQLSPAESLNIESWVPPLPRVFAGSEFVALSCARHPAVLRELIESGDLFRAYTEGELGRRIERELAGVPDEATL